MQLASGALLLLMVSETLGWSWTALHTRGPRVSGHTASAAAGDKVLLFGDLTGAAGSPVTADLEQFENGEWKALDIKEGPGRRMYSASAVLDGSLYLAAGIRESREVEEPFWMTFGVSTWTQ